VTYQGCAVRWVAGRQICAGPHPVAMKQPNAWGLYDMIGNDWEWVHDWYDDRYYRDSPTHDPTGPDTGTRRILRGGNWAEPAENCRSAIRFGYDPNQLFGGLGIRPARTANP